MYTRKEDAALSGVSDILTLYDMLGDRKTEDLIPGENEGLLINLSDVLLTKTMMYLDALMDERQEYTDYGELIAIDINDFSEQDCRRSIGQQIVQKVLHDQAENQSADGQHNPLFLILNILIDPHRDPHADQQKHHRKNSEDFRIICMDKLI